jgi:hypothetical protein
MFSLMLRPACGGAAATTAAKSGGGGCGGGHGSKRAHGSRTSIIGSPGSSTSSAASVFRSHAILVASSALGSSARVGQTRSSPTSWACPTHKVKSDELGTARSGDEAHPGCRRGWAGGKSKCRGAGMLYTEASDVGLTPR